MNSDHEPYRPERSLRFLQWFCPPELLEEIEGDLIQKFEWDVKSFGEGKAKRRLLWNVIRFFRPEIVLKNKFSNQQNPMMISNYFKVAYRVMLRNKSYSFINLLSLALGLTSFAFLFLWIHLGFFSLSISISL